MFEKHIPFECKVCEYKNYNKEELDIHILNCEIYVCSLCSYKQKRLCELKVIAIHTKYNHKTLQDGQGKFVKAFIYKPF